MVLNATFIPVILWLSVSLLEETEISEKLDHILFYQAHLAMSGIRTHSFSGNLHCKSTRYICITDGHGYNPNLVVSHNFVLLSSFKTYHRIYDYHRICNVPNRTGVVN
jgi:hypothetical protein